MKRHQMQKNTVDFKYFQNLCFSVLINQVVLSLNGTEGTKLNCAILLNELNVPTLMALLGMQADMQYKSFFPGHYSTMDLNLDANGSIWPLNNIDKIFMNGHDYNGALLLPSPHQHLVQNKDTLKQAMLKHEAIFKDQVLLCLNFQF
ncbi:hypothetical protein Patl1_18820 [Pistacia atlantica]|uniref:Uncharacterized protein n=1 Tax=Pistacia atlantica TaxID=434234 RepID=A0ACC1C3N2_9ROSI|nr:hypothetical protein Patl1_18820 [Pistacia atlantica]